MAEGPAPIDPIPIVTAATVREQIIARIFDYMKAIESCGVVADYASEGDDDLKSISECVNAGKYAIEILPAQSDLAALNTTLNRHTWEMSVLLIVHLPYDAEILPYQAASRICSTIFKIVHPTELAMGTWDGLAIQTRWDSGTDGAEVFIDPKTNLPSIAILFRVNYAHAFSNPGVQA